MGIVPNILIKFLEQEYVDNFVKNGELYFKQNYYFRGLELTGEDAAERGDRYEGHRNHGLDPKRHEIFVRNASDKNGTFLRVPNLKKVVHREYNPLLDNIPIACFVQIYKEEHFDFDGKSFKLSSSVVNKLNGIRNNRPCIIISFQEYIDRIIKHGNINDIPLRANEVKYFNESLEENVKYDDYMRDSIDALFYKSKKYENQMEYRIIWNEVTAKDMKLNIGPIDDISYVIDKDTELNDFPMALYIDETELN